MKVQNIDGSGWTAFLEVDEDGHLTFTATHQDRSEPVEIEYDAFDFDTEVGWRLSTKKIERSYETSEGLSK